MSDSCLYELEGTAWDDIYQSGDHIVPHPDGEHGYGNALQDDSHKKPRGVVINVSSDTGDCGATKYASKGMDERHFTTLTNQSSMMPSHCFKNRKLDSIGSEVCADDLSIGKRHAAVDNDASSYLLDEADNSLSVNDNGGEEKESSELLYHDWPDIGNFEYVDRMFRSCDSTFEAGGVGDGDGLGWFSASHVVEGSALDQMQSMEDSHGYSFEATVTRMDEKQGKLHQQHGFQTSFMNGQKQDLVDQGTSNSVSVHSEVVTMSLGLPAEDSSNAHESSCVNSVSDEISLEATSFRQLRHIMEQLDLRTTLCIRDSLYRLARSAEQRNNYANPYDGFRDEVESNKANKYSELMDMETDTNPIDRSVAHLLFHRSSDSSLVTASL